MKLELEVKRFENEDVIATSTIYKMDTDHLWQKPENGKLYITALDQKPPIPEINPGDTVTAKDGITYDIVNSDRSYKIVEPLYKIEYFMGTWRSSDNKNWVVE